MDAPIAIVRGVGDVGSAIAWKLFQAGFVVICHENRQPRTIRRRMAFCDALWKGEAVLQGVCAQKVDRVEQLLPVAQERKQVAVYSGPFEAALKATKPSLIIDGRIQKFTKVEALKGLAPLTIGVGPSFEAGKHVDLVVESCWGDDLGKVISQGCASAPVPLPPKLNGIGWERFVRAEGTGVFETALDIGQYVEKGDLLGQLGGKPVLASITGYLRGLLTPGLKVINGEKLAEIDPREDLAHFEGLAERPRGIAWGVLSALHRSLPIEARPQNLKMLLDQGGLDVSGDVAKIC
ncbi:hypothetical protein [Terasakiella sp. SH-1]|uniref:hypothetical protein n=1 Tax=Terasakiella sp. SH-1 TaxID=2560057 RepID=UPI00107397F5|nr:hypothetical protein [Terasakiella sp. SH-1]